MLWRHSDWKMIESTVPREFNSAYGHLGNWKCELYLLRLKFSQQAQPDFTWLRFTLDENKILYSVKSSLTGLKGAHCWTLLKVKFQREQIEDDEDPYINCTTLYSRSFFRKLQRTILSNYLIMAWRYYPWLVGLHGTFS